MTRGAGRPAGRALAGRDRRGRGQRRWRRSTACRAGAEREELRNLATVGWALLRAAEAREESRGCHTREDFPDRDPAFQLRLVLR